MDTIPVVCKTNLDDARREEWPTKMAARPFIGDLVCSKSGRWLKVGSVVHCMGRVIGGEVVPATKTEAQDDPYILIELTRLGATCGL